MNNFWRYPGFAAVLATLAACGGGGSGNSDTGKTPAAVEQQSMAVPAHPVVRFVYFVPAGDTESKAYTDAVADAAATVQRWYAQQLDGRSFRLASPVVQTCRGTQPAAFYATRSWSRVFAAVQDCIAGFNWDSPDYRWVIYAQVRHQCGDPEFLGAASRGVAMVPVQDLQGLAAQPSITDDCGKPLSYAGPQGVGRWQGGLAHELGHALGLSHPAGCEDGSPNCDQGALMWTGYANFPDTRLREDERARLSASPFIQP